LKEKKGKKFIAPSLAKSKSSIFKRGKLFERVERKRAKIYFVSFGF
jgi:hypothetical protein